jgi:hypothetical protein
LISSKKKESWKSCCLIWSNLRKSCNLHDKSSFASFALEFDNSPIRDTCSVVRIRTVQNDKIPIQPAQLVLGPADWTPIDWNGSKTERSGPLITGSHGFLFVISQNCEKKFKNFKKKIQKRLFVILIQEVQFQLIIWITR